jgi:hypothetical protein
MTSFCEATMEQMAKMWPPFGPRRRQQPSELDRGGGAKKDLPLGAMNSEVLHGVDQGGRC